MRKEWLEVNSDLREECGQNCEDSEHDTFEELPTGRPSWCRVLGGEKGSIGSWGGERSGQISEIFVG